MNGRRLRSYSMRAAIVAAVGLLIYAIIPSDPHRLGRRLRSLEAVVAHARTLPAGKHSIAELPPEIRPDALLKIYVDPRGVYAMEYMSEVTIDLNPAFVYVDFETPDPEGVVREVCRKCGLTYRNPFRERGWYHATGM